MNYNNPEELPIVGEENSHSKLVEETKEEGREAKREYDRGGKTIINPYAKGSTFWHWWRFGYNEEVRNRI